MRERSLPRTQKRPNDVVKKTHDLKQLQLIALLSASDLWLWTPRFYRKSMKMMESPKQYFCVIWRSEQICSIAPHITASHHELCILYIRSHSLRCIVQTIPGKIIKASQCDFIDFNFSTNFAVVPTPPPKNMATICLNKIAVTKMAFQPWIPPSCAGSRRTSFSTLQGCACAAQR